MDNKSKKLGIADDFVTETRETYEGSKKFLSEHRHCDYFIYDEKTKLPIVAVYTSPYFRDEKIKEEMLSLIREFIKSRELGIDI